MIRRIAIIGPECTGKSELSMQLARTYDTEWVPEFARFYLDRLSRPYKETDLVEIAKGQVAWEDDKAGHANDFLFCDTNLIVIKVWSEHKFGKTDPWIEAELKRRTYDYYLLNNIDLVWRPDPQREHPQLRKHFFDIYKKYLTKHGLPYGIVSGAEDDRTKHAIDLIEDFFYQ